MTNVSELYVEFLVRIQVFYNNHINVTNELGLVKLIVFLLFCFLSYSCKDLGCVQYSLI